MKSTPVYMQLLVRYTSVNDRIAMKLNTHLVYQHRGVKEYKIINNDIIEKKSQSTERPVTTFQKKNVLTEKYALNLS